MILFMHLHAILRYGKKVNLIMPVTLDFFLFKHFIIYFL